MFSPQMVSMPDRLKLSRLALLLFGRDPMVRMLLAEPPCFWWRSFCLSVLLPSADAPKSFLASGKRHGIQAPISTQFPSMLV